MGHICGANSNVLAGRTRLPGWVKFKTRKLDFSKASTWRNCLAMTSWMVRKTVAGNNLKF